MIKTEPKALIITLPHPFPKEAVSDLQAGIIAVLKYQYLHYDQLLQSDQKLIEGNHLLLELLEATLQQDEEQPTPSEP